MGNMHTDSQNRRDKASCKRYSFKFDKSRGDDFHIVYWLEKQYNKQDAVRQAIMYYLENSDDVKPAEWMPSWMIPPSV